MAIYRYLTLYLVIVAILRSSTPLGTTIEAVGVCYGQLGNNLPPPAKVVALYRQHNLKKMRIYQPDPAVLNALKGSGIQVTVGTYNKDVPVLAQSPAAAQTWFEANIKPYVGTVNIAYITIGNEIYPSQPSANIAPAMRNLQGVLNAAGLSRIKVSTVVSMEVLRHTYPPSKSIFADPQMAAITSFLKSQNSQLLVNIYPYFAYAGKPAEVKLDYATFASSSVVVHDGAMGYTNLFDAMVDSFYWAMEKVGATNVGVVVSETGWPHAGGSPSITTLQLAANYNKGLVKHLQTGKGTPKKPNVALEAFIFAMFDENQKAAGVEQNWGLFKPSGQPNYNLF